MKPEQLVKQLTSVSSLNLRSVILYGSAAAGDHTGKRSDYNILVITEKLDLPELEILSKPTVAWTRAGNPPPLLFTIERLKKSADVFPIELLDMKESHIVLFGEDVLEEVEVSSANLRLELEHELKGKLIQLRERFLTTPTRPRAVADLLITSLSTFLVLFRAALRLFQDNIPAKKMDALKALADHIPCDPSVFETIQALKEGREKIREHDIINMFDRYLRTVENVVDAVDSYIHKTNEGENK